MKRSASEVIRNLESRIARLENKSAGLKFNVEVVSDHNGKGEGSKQVDLKGLKSLMKSLESLTRKEIQDFS